MEKTFEKTMRIMIAFAICSAIAIAGSIAYDLRDESISYAVETPTEILTKPVSNK